MTGRIRRAQHAGHLRDARPTGARYCACARICVCPQGLASGDGCHVRQSATRARRWGPRLLLAPAVVLLAGCSAETRAQWERGGLPKPATEQALIVERLWQGAWVAAFLV